MLVTDQIEDAVKKYFLKSYERELSMIKHDFEGERTIKYAHSTSREETYRVEIVSFYLEDGRRIEVLFARCYDKIYYDWRIKPLT